MNFRLQLNRFTTPSQSGWYIAIYAVVLSLVISKLEQIYTYLASEDCTVWALLRAEVIMLE